MFQPSVCTLSSDHVHTQRSGKQGRAGALGWAGLEPSSARIQVRRTQKTGGRAGSRWRQRRSRPACAAGQGGAGPLTSTRRPMLAMCGEQSLTVSSFSICRDSVQSEKPHSLPPPTHPHSCPLVLWRLVALLLQDHFSSTDDSSFGLYTAQPADIPKPYHFQGIVSRCCLRIDWRAEPHWPDHLSSHRSRLPQVQTATQVWVRPGVALESSCVPTLPHLDPPSNGTMDPAS